VYYALAKSLRNGLDEPGNRRPPIPIEIIVMIFDLASLIRPVPRRHIKSKGGLSVSSDGPRTSGLFIHSAPLDSAALRCIRQMQLETISHDQGWSDEPGSWTWFDIVILNPLEKGDEFTQGESLGMLVFIRVEHTS
jgi:hypothetical protein